MLKQKKNLETKHNAKKILNAPSKFEFGITNRTRAFEFWIGRVSVPTAVPRRTAAASNKPRANKLLTDMRTSLYQMLLTFLFDKGDN